MKGYKTKLIKVSELKAHPKNYREHPEDQLEHIIQSIEQNGFYRNIVLAKDMTILAGHGVVQAVKKMDMQKVPAVVLDIDADSPQALKVLTGDNEIGHLGMVNDRMLTEVLKEIQENDEAGLFGTGYDEMMLANLLYVTRPKSEIESINEAEEWVGMPDFDGIEAYSSKIAVEFRTEADRVRFFKIINAEKHAHRKSFLWPCDVDKDDPVSVKFSPEENDEV